MLAVQTGGGGTCAARAPFAVVRCVYSVRCFQAFKDTPPLCKDLGWDAPPQTECFSPQYVNTPKHCNSKGMGSRLCDGKWSRWGNTAMQQVLRPGALLPLFSCMSTAPRVVRTHCKCLSSQCLGTTIPGTRRTCVTMGPGEEVLCERQTPIRGPEHQSSWPPPHRWPQGPQ